MLPFVTAAGDVLMIVYILLFQKTKKGEVQLELPLLHPSMVTRSVIPKYYVVA